MPQDQEIQAPSSKSSRGYNAMTEETKDRLEKLDGIVRKFIRAFLERNYAQAFKYLFGAGISAVVALLALKDIIGQSGKTILLAVAALTGLTFFLWVVAIAREELKQKPASPEKELDKKRRARKMKDISVLILLAVATISVVTAAVAGSAWVIRRLASVSASEQALLSAWGYPSDLVTRQNQLDSLTLGPAVTSVAWLTADLTDLDLTGTRVQTIKELSPILHTLSLGETPITELPDLPSGLRELDVSWLRLSRLDKLPPHLEVLRLENVTPEEPAALPDSLADLTVSGDIEDWLARWPQNLKRLHLIDTRFEDLSALPESLEVLRIHNPAADTIDLATLPRNIKKLELSSVALPHLGSLPPGLRVLELRHADISDLCILVEDNTDIGTKLQEDFRSRNHDLPDNLEMLTLEGVETRRFCGLPGKLVSFEFLPSDSIPNVKFEDLPESLKSLKMTWPATQTLRDLPALIEDLSITWSEVAELDDLPEYVKRLDLSESKIVGFRGRVPAALTHLTMKGCPAFSVSELPSGLVMLDVQGCRNLRTLPVLPDGLRMLNVSRTAVRGLANLPPRLKELDISNTGIRSIEGVPQYLESLTVHEGQVDSLKGLPDSVRRLVFVEVLRPETEE